MLFFCFFKETWFLRESASASRWGRASYLLLMGPLNSFRPPNLTPKSPPSVTSAHPAGTAPPTDWVSCEWIAERNRCTLNYPGERRLRCRAWLSDWAQMTRHTLYDVGHAVLCWLKSGLTVSRRRLGGWGAEAKAPIFNQLYRTYPMVIALAICHCGSKARPATLKHHESPKVPVQIEHGNRTC